MKTNHKLWIADCDAACVDDIVECLSIAMKEIVEEISQDLHLILSLQPKSRH